jgi:hypothetical protein
MVQGAQEWTRVEPEHWRFGGGASDTVLHPIVLVAMLVAVIIILALPKRAALTTFLFSMFLIPLGQQFLVGGVHLFVGRVIIAAGWIRMLSDPNAKGMKVFGKGLNGLDKAFVLYVVVRVVAFTALNLNGAAVVNQVGFVWDFLGGYVLLRYLIRTDEDVTRAFKALAYLAVILSIFMIREQMTGENAFGLLGGVNLVSDVRQGRIRSNAVFQHAILAGVFGSTLVPLMIWLWKSGKAKVLSVVGTVAGLTMAITSACSTPLAAFGGALVGLFFFPIRKFMRPFRWGLGLTLVALHFGMKAPVWALIERIDVVQGSSSYHRYQLVDQFIRHWMDWFLVGTNSNASWGDFMFDVSNQYVAEGTTGGFFALALFIYQICWCFGRLGLARKAAEKQAPGKEWILWLLGVALLAHMTAFLGISYFDQMRVAWFTLLASIAVVSQGFLDSQRAAARSAEQSRPILEPAEQFWGADLQPARPR